MKALFPIFIPPSTASSELVFAFHRDMLLPLCCLFNPLSRPFRHLVWFVIWITKPSFNSDTDGTILIDRFNAEYQILTSVSSKALYSCNVHDVEKNANCGELMNHLQSISMCSPVIVLSHYLASGPWRYLMWFRLTETDLGIS